MVHVIMLSVAYLKDSFGLKTIFLTFIILHINNSLIIPPNSYKLITTEMLSTYLNKTFGSEQHCLHILVEGTQKSAIDNIDILSTLYRVSSNMSTPRNIELIISYNYSMVNYTTKGNNPCAAIVAIVGSQIGVEWAMEEVQHNFAERILLIVNMQTWKYKFDPKYTPKYFNYTDVILITIDKEKESVFRMDLYHKKFIKISKNQNKWFLHNIQGEGKVKNFHGAQIKLYAFNNSLFNTVKKNKITGESELGDGVETRIFKEIANRLNVKVKLISSNSEDHWNKMWPNRTWAPGTIQMLYDREVDVAFGALWIQYSKIGFIEMSDYWGFMCLKFLVPKPIPLRNKWDFLLKPFPLSLWLMLLAATLINTLTLWMAGIVQKKIGYKYIDKFTTLSSSSFWILGSMLMTSYPKQLHHLGPIRHLINWWCLFMFIIATAFSSVLYSHITSPEYTSLVSSIKDMINNGYTWGLPYLPFSDQEEMENPWHNKFNKSFILEKSTADRINRLKHGKYALLTECINEKYFMELQNVPPSLLSDLRTKRTCLNNFYHGIGFSKHSPYLKSANLVIRHLVESGIIEYWFHRIIEKKLPLTTFDRVYEQKPQSDQNNGPSSLTYYQLRAVIAVWLIGCILSTIVFIIEYKYFTIVQGHI